MSLTLTAKSPFYPSFPSPFRFRMCVLLVQLLSTISGASSSSTPIQVDLLLDGIPIDPKITRTSRLSPFCEELLNMFEKSRIKVAVIGLDATCISVPQPTFIFVFTIIPLPQIAMLFETIHLQSTIQRVSDRSTQPPRFALGSVAGSCMLCFVCVWGACTEVSKCWCDWETSSCSSKRSMLWGLKSLIKTIFCFCFGSCSAVY